MLGIRLINEKQGKVYEFTDKEVLELFRYAYGYIDLIEDRAVKVFDDDNGDSVALRRKFKQCFKDEFKVTKNIRRFI